MVQINFFFNCRLSLLILRKPHNSSFVVYETSIGSEVMISAPFCKWQKEMISSVLQMAVSRVREPVYIAGCADRRRVI